MTYLSGFLHANLQMFRISETMPGSGVAVGHRKRSCPRSWLGFVLRRRHPPTSASRKIRESQHENVGSLEHNDI